MAGSHRLSLSNLSFTEGFLANAWSTSICLFNFMCGGVLPAYIFMHDMLAWCPQSPEEGPKFPGTGVSDSCKLPCGWWESSPHPQKEQWVFDHWTISLQTPGSSPSISLPHTSETYSEMFGKLLAIGFFLTICLSNSFFSVFSTQLIPNALLMLN